MILMSHGKEFLMCYLFGGQITCEGIKICLPQHVKNILTLSAPFLNIPLGAHASASIYSIIETAKANGHEPYHYLCYLFNELTKAKSLEEKLKLLPYKIAPTEY